MEKLDPHNYIENDIDMKEYINQLVNDLRDDIEIYEQIKRLNLTNKEVRDNIAKLTEFKHDFHYCKACPGIEKCNKQIPHLKMLIIKDGNYVSSSFEPCDKIIEKIHHDSRYLYADFPVEWKYSSTKTLDMSEKRRPVIKEFSKIVSSESTRWLYVLANHKVGKSFMMISLVNDYMSVFKGKVAVLNTPNRIKELIDLSYKDKEEFAHRVFELENVSLLMLDDFGEEYKNEYIRDALIIPLLSEREHKNLMTFFASEFSIDEIQKMYSIGANSGEIRGKQLGRILKEMCIQEFDISGSSLYRK